MGDGEQQEGNIWEAVMEGSHYKLDNLVGIIDRNRLQIDGWVKDVMNVEPLEERYRSFGWEVIVCDGHDMPQVVDGLQNAKKIPVAGKPTVVICNTVKGKGVSFMENVAGWHGKAPSYDEMVKALDELGLKQTIAYDALLKQAAEYQKTVEAKLDAKMPKFTNDYWWNSRSTMKVAMEPTRKGFGKSLQNNGDDERVVCLGLDISGSITISDFYSGKPERKNRWISMGIAEQSATAAAAGLAREGKLPVFGTYGTFAAARNLDQIRVSICYGNFNVMIAGAHGGVSVGPDGATHQALEDLFAMCGLPNMVVSVPCDSIETRKATDYLLMQHEGPKYIRFAREATPIVTREDTPFVFGKANVIRLRREAEQMIDAFDTVLASHYMDEGRRPEHHRLRSDGARSHARGVDPEERIRLRDARAQHSYPQADRRSSDSARRKRNGRCGHRRRAPDRRTGMARQQRPHRKPRTVRHASHHRRYRRERPLRRFRRALGADQGIRSQRRAHRAKGSRVGRHRASQERRRAVGGGAVRHAVYQLALQTTDLQVAITCVAKTLPVRHCAGIPPAARPGYA